MELEIINPYIVKIIIAAREKDSINSIAKRIKISYGWTYKWIHELAKIGVFKKTRSKLYLNQDDSFYQKVLHFIKESFSEDIAFHYSVIDLFGIRYCFTQTDAVFVWTKGAYNIARYKKNYPIFIKIAKADKKIFQFYMEKLGSNNKIYYKPIFVEEFSCEFLDSIPVDSLQETISFMKRYIYNFQPALEMIEELYHERTGIKYKEVAND